MTRNLNAKWSDFPAALTVGAQVLLIDADPLGTGARARSSGRSRRHQLGGQRAAWRCSMDMLSGSETAQQTLLQERGPDGLGAPVVAAARDGAPVRASSEVAARKRQRAAH